MYVPSLLQSPNSHAYRRLSHVQEVLPFYSDLSHGMPTVPETETVRLPHRKRKSEEALAVQSLGGAWG